MTASPELKFNGLIDRLNEIVGAGNYTDFELKRIEKEAINLVKTDAASSFIIQGIIACIRCNTADTIKFHKKSLALDNGVLPKLHYAYSLINIGHYGDSFKILEDVYKVVRDDLVFLNYMIEAAIFGLRFRRASSLIKDWEKMHHNEVHKDEEMINAIVALMDETDISEEDMYYAQQVLSAVLEKGYKVRGRQISIKDDEGFKWLDFEYLVKTPMDDIFEMNHAFSAKIVEDGTPSKLLEHVVIRFGRHY